MSHSSIKYGIEIDSVGFNQNHSRIVFEYKINRL